MRRFQGRGAAVGLPAVALALTVGFAVPASAATGDQPWLDTDRTPQERAELLVDAMTLEQKIQQIAMDPGEAEGDEQFPGCTVPFVGRHIEGIPELGIPTIRYTNGTSGVKGGDCDDDAVATALPTALAVAATFDRQASFEWGDITGEETKLWNHQGLLTPAMTIIRHPYGGRGYEYFSEDPFLAGMISIPQVEGIEQNGVQAAAKHFVVNSQETERWTMGENVPAQAMHELYLLPFEMTARETSVSSFMCAFPELNGDYSCENEQLLNDTLRERWGYDGYVMSDRRAVHSTLDTLQAGLDLEFGWRQYFAPDIIERYLDSGELTVEHIDQMLIRRFTQMFELGQFEHDWQSGTTVDDEGRMVLGDADFYAEHGEIAREIAEESMVLLKNEGDVLPLTGEEETVALIGAFEYAGQAKRASQGGARINDYVVSDYTVTPEEGLNNVIDNLGHDTEVVYNDASDLDSAVELAEEADVVILMVGDVNHELRDRLTLELPATPKQYNREDGRDSEDVDDAELPLSDDIPDVTTCLPDGPADGSGPAAPCVNQEELVEAIAGVNPNTVMVLKTGGAVLMPWRDEFPAILEAWYPGQEDGNAVANILYGVANPSGKLPVTFGVSEREAAFATERQFPGVRGEDDDLGGPFFDEVDDWSQLNVFYDEGLEMGYRWYEANDVEPAYWFGHGLSYTTFEYSDLSITPTKNASGARAVSVDFTLTNTGDRAGQEAAQVYLTLPSRAGQPGKRLVAVEKVHLEAGESIDMSIELDSEASSHPFSYFEPESDDLTQWAAGDWVTPRGRYTFHVGTSAGDTALEETVRLTFPEPDRRDGDIPIEATIPDFSQEPGSLTLRIEAPGSVDLGTARTQRDRLRFDGDLPPVVVTDSRNNAQASGGGWSVTGRAAPFVSDDDEFSASYLGWEPWTTADDRPGVTAGPQVHGELRGGPGLAEPATLVSATNVGRRGAATAGAHLLLEVPLDTPPGEYRSSISLSLFAVD